MGIDPSFTATGFAITLQHANKQTLLHHGFLPLPTSLELSGRIGLFHEVLSQKVSEYKVARISIETPFLGKNAQTFLKLGYLRGVLHLIAHQHNISIVEFSPAEVKRAITSSGSAEKQQVSRMIHMLFPSLPQQKSHDVTDAIAISLCGLWYNNPMK